MPHTSSQTFLRELDKKLWTAADRLRSNLDAAVYKHAVLGLIFLKYVSDSFAQRQAEIEAMIKDPDSDFYMPPDSYDSPAKYEAAIHAELEERDYYLEKNVFWVPALARWKTVQDSAKLPPGTEILPERGSPTRSYKITSTGKLIDDALEAIEKENVKLKGVLDRRYTQLQIDPVNRAERVRLPARAARRGRAAARINLSSLIDLIASIPFQHADLHAKDILGHFFSPNGATHTSLGHRPRLPSARASRALKGRHIKRRSKVSNSNPTTWRLAAMNMAIRGSPRHSAATPCIDFNFGKEPANSFTQDQHPDLRADLRADYVMALPSAAARSHLRSHTADRPAGRINPPFNIKEWWDGKLEGDARWSRSEAESASHAKFYKNRGKYGTPPQTATRECAPLNPEGTPQVVSEARDKNANFAWVQHMLHHLAPNLAL